jgi:hypothetical protein
VIKFTQIHTVILMESIKMMKLAFVFTDQMLKTWNVKWTQRRSVLKISLGFCKLIFRFVNEATLRGKKGI